MDVFEALKILNENIDSRQLIEKVKDNIEIDKRYSYIAEQMLNELQELYYDEGLYESRANTNYIDTNVRRDIVQNGRIDIRGYDICTVQGFCDFCRVLRDVRYETFRIIYVKDGKIVGQDAITSKLPGNVYALKYHKAEKDQLSNSNAIRSFEEYKRKYDRLNADGYFLLHNHPSGSVEPSMDDEVVTNTFKENLPGYMAHILIGLNDAVCLDTGEIYHLDDDDFKRGNRISNKEVAKEFFNRYKNKKDYSLIAYVDNKLCCLAVQEIKNTEFNDSNIWRWVSKESRDNGAGKALLYTESLDVFNKSIGSIINGILLDSFYAQKEHDGLTRVFSAKEISKLSKKDAEEKIKIYNESIIKGE